MVTELGEGTGPTLVPPGVIRIGVDRAGGGPTEGLDAFDILLSADLTAPRPWVGLGAGPLDEALDRLGTAIDHQPVAAAVLAQVLRLGDALTFDQALTLESLAYSMLLASEGFRGWRAGAPVRTSRAGDEVRVSMAKEAGVLRITLSRPAARNAFDAAMRDALVEALDFAMIDPDHLPIELCGEGPAFSAGGDLDEFGTATDGGLAHLIRTLRSPARLVQGLGDRLQARVHGACVGAGIEIPAAAQCVTAQPGAHFRLPEVAMGLIPGAGGTASIPRRIGRHRACYMALSGAEIDLATALAWGLVDHLELGQ